MSTIATSAATSRAPSTLQRLYVARFGFAVVWASVLLTTTSALGALAVTLLVLYPLVDVAAAVVDARRPRVDRAPALLLVNIAISLVAALGVALACASGIPAVLRVWGAWAVVAGVVQLLLGVARRPMGGQWPIIASGGISVLAGAAFIVGASATDPTLSNVAGYAIAGGIFFLVSGLRLGRVARS